MEKTKMPERDYPHMQQMKIHIDFKHDPLRSVPGFGYDLLNRPGMGNGGNPACHPVPSHRAVPQPVIAEIAVALFQLRQMPQLKPHAEHLLSLLCTKIGIDQETVSRIVKPS